jgi:hypothetical protein
MSDIASTTGCLHCEFVHNINVFSRHYTDTHIKVYSFTLSLSLDYKQPVSKPGPVRCHLLDPPQNPDPCGVISWTPPKTLVRFGFICSIVY